MGGGREEEGDEVKWRADNGRAEEGQQEINKTDFYCENRESERGREGEEDLVGADECEIKVKRDEGTKKGL